jgi:hypothetical protein
MDTAEARTIWHLIETVHAVTYFNPTCIDARKDQGFKGFWMGYFGSRAAPMGAVGPGVTTATFAGFDPSMVRRALPDAWTYCSPDDAIEGRAAAAAEALREVWSAVTGNDAAELEDVAESVLDPLSHSVELADPGGRALFASNADLMPLDDPVADMWQLCTTMREHRGDGHVAVLVSEGLSGCEPHILAAAATGIDPEYLRSVRGWPEQEWKEATETLGAAGLVSAEGGLTERGAQFREHMETRTDDLASPPYVQLGAAGRSVLLGRLGPLARAISASGHIPFPNPIGLPGVA